MAEWSIALHWKCSVPQGTEGSNPSLSARWVLIEGTRNVADGYEGTRGQGDMGTWNVAYGHEWASGHGDTGTWGDERTRRSRAPTRFIKIKTKVYLDITPCHLVPMSPCPLASFASVSVSTERVLCRRRVQQLWVRWLRPRLCFRVGWDVRSRA